MRALAVLNSAVRARAASPFRSEAFSPALTSRKYFPGYEVYFHIDADAWVQDWAAVELYIAGARKGVMAVSPEIDRSFISNYRNAIFVSSFTLCSCFISNRESYGFRTTRSWGRMANGSDYGGNFGWNISKGGVKGQSSAQCSERC
jgi:hypothetical protein